MDWGNLSSASYADILQGKAASSPVNWDPEGDMSFLMDWSLSAVSARRPPRLDVVAVKFAAHLLKIYENEKEFLQDYRAGQNGPDSLFHRVGRNLFPDDKGISHDLKALWNEDSILSPSAPFSNVRSLVIDIWRRREKKDEIIYGQPASGIANLGNTCFAAAALQVLFGCKLFVDHIRGHECGNSCMLCAVKEIYLDALTHTLVGPFLILPVFKMISKDLDFGQQQDSAHILMGLLEATSKERKMEGVLMQRVECQEDGCGYVSTSKPPFMTLEVGVRRSLAEALQEDFKEALLTGVEMYACPRCGKKTEAVLKKAIVTKPEVLVIQVKRFHYNQDTASSRRIDSPMKIPEVLNIQKERYSLVGVVLHDGPSATQGHYTAIVRVGDQYKLFNDSVLQVRLRLPCPAGSRKTPLYGYSKELVTIELQYLGIDVRG